MKFKILVRKWHKWLALIVGVQILFWTVSGLYMSFVPIETIRSEHRISPPDKKVIQSGEKFLSPGELAEKFPAKNIVKMTLKSDFSTFVYKLSTKDGKKIIVDALSGEKLNPFSESYARKRALSYYKGEHEIQQVTFRKDPIIEYRGELPVWKVDFANSENTTFYVSPRTGELTAARSLLWRVFDFLWMLHIMDYDERSDFNNWLLVLASILGVSVSLTGITLFFYSFRFKRRKRT